MKHKTYQDLTESIRLIMEKTEEKPDRPDPRTTKSDVANLSTNNPTGQQIAAAQSATQSAAQTANTQPAQELSQAQALAKSRGVTDYDSLPQWRKDAFEANAARKGMENILSKATSPSL